MTDEYSAGFSIHTDHEDVIADNAGERFGSRYGDASERAEAMAEGWVDAKGNITSKGWQILNKDIAQLERNSVAWLRSTFVSARDEGHDRDGDLIGAVWFDLDAPAQVEALDMGLRERIDMNDPSYGDLSKSVWKGVSRFGESVLGGAIHFFDVSKGLVEEIEERAWKLQRRPRSRAR